jgi:hypothetical protein
MPNEPKNHGEPWTRQAVQQLKQLAKQNTPTRVIALLTGRTEDAIRNAASQNDISLKPTNQSPYNRKKK